jgi:hypothetical protein
MALVGFEDGSYVELISKTKPDETAPWWDREIDDDAGASAWAVPSEDIASDSTRLREDGFEVDGPQAFSRERPDDKLVEWELTKVGTGSQGGTYPMLIMDHTPLERRVTVTADVETTGLGGVETTVLATPTGSFENYVDGFERFFETEHSSLVEDTSFGGRVARFEDAPVAVATPLGQSSWLADRVDQFGAIPCAYLLDVADAETVLDRFAIDETTDWGGGSVHWFDVDEGGAMGAIDRA